MKTLFFYRGRESLGIEYLSSSLEQAGHEVDMIFDPGLDDNYYWRNPLLRNLHNEDLMVEKARRFSPDLLAFSSTTNEYPAVCRTAHLLRGVLKVPVIVGGIHPTSLPERVIANPDIDIICRGEGERAIVELADRMERGVSFDDIPNLWIRKPNGDTVRNGIGDLIGDLDSLPFPDKRSFFEYGCFRELVMVISGRGCPFSCSYCHNNVCRRMYRGKGSYIRRRSPRNVVDELKQHMRDFGSRRVSFQDDLFVMDRKWLEEFAELYLAEVALPFSCNAFPTLIDEETVTLLGRMGCMDLFVGIDAGNEQLRREILKRETPDAEIRRNIAIVRKHRIPLELSVVFGFPGETPEMMWETVNLVNDLRPSAVQSHILYPFPDTEVFETSKRMGLLDPEVEEAICTGRGSIVDETVLKHPHGDLAYVLARMIALYVKLPGFLKPLARLSMRPGAKRLSNFLFLATIPLVFPWQGVLRLRETLRMALATRRKLASDCRNQASGAEGAA